MSDPLLAPDVLAGVREVLADALFVDVFGSTARGRARSDSDLDLAARWNRPLPVADLAERTGRLEAICGRPVDLVDLGTADPIVAMQVVRYGRPLLTPDTGARAAFRAHAPSLYFDLKRDRAPVEARMRRSATR